MAKTEIVFWKRNVFLEWEMFTYERLVVFKENSIGWVSVLVDIQGFWYVP